MQFGEWIPRRTFSNFLPWKIAIRNRATLGFRATFHLMNDTSLLPSSSSAILMIPSSPANLFATPNPATELTCFSWHCHVVHPWFILRKKRLLIWNSVIYFTSRLIYEFQVLNKRNTQTYSQALHKMCISRTFYESSCFWISGVRVREDKSCTTVLELQLQGRVRGIWKKKSHGASDGLESH